MKNGGFVISLDFELMWGVRDRKTTESYGTEIKKVHTIVPKTAKAFQDHGVKATFATVGILLLNKEDILNPTIPSILPNYKDQNLSPYKDLSQLKEQPHNPYYFCPDLIQLLKELYPEQEIATHTFSHYYCLEKGQTIEEFEADLSLAKMSAEKQGLGFHSIVFPRNQTHEAYIEICKKYGIQAYRGVEKAWYYQSEAKKEETKLKRAFRLIDTYINLSGHNTFLPVTKHGLLNIPSSRFFRPYRKKLSFLEPQKIRRIKKAMTNAAKKNELFHLWWHPHNFGAHTEKMFHQLEEILAHFDMLNQEFNYQSYTMKEVVDLVNRT